MLRRASSLVLSTHNHLFAVWQRIIPPLIYQLHMNNHDIRYSRPPHIFLTSLARSVFFHEIRLSLFLTRDRDHKHLSRTMLVW